MFGLLSILRKRADLRGIGSHMPPPDKYHECVPASTGTSPLTVDHPAALEIPSPWPNMKLMQIFKSCILLVFLSSPVLASDPWTGRDYLLLGSLLVLDAIDWGQTLNINTYRHKEYTCENGHRVVTEEYSFHEVNPLIGKNPKRGRVNAYFSILIPAQILGAAFLGQPYRTILLASGVSVKLACVTNNYRLGIQCSF
jgi:hypothetical protein